MKPIMMRKAFNVILVLALLVISASTFIPIVQAANPTVTRIGGVGSGVSGASSENANPTLTASTTIIAFIEEISNSTSTPMTVSSITDTKSLTWTLLQASIISPQPTPVGSPTVGYVSNEVWYAQTGAASGLDTVTFHYAATTDKYHMVQVTIDQISTQMSPAVTSNLPTSVSASSSGTGSPWVLNMIAGAVQYPANTMIIVGVDAAFCNSGCASAPAFTNPTFPNSGSPTLTQVTTWSNGCVAGNAKGPCEDQNQAYVYDTSSENPTWQASWSETNTGNAGSVSEIVTYWNVNGLSGGTQTQNVGSCPAKNTATFTMVNSTIYMYYATAPGNIAVQNAETFVASTTGSGSHTLRILIYETQSPVSAGLTLTTSSVSVGFPLFKIIDYPIVLSSGTVNSLVLVNVAVGVTTGNLWGVGIIGDNKIKINQSSTSGVFTEAGAASTGAQPSKFTTAGTSVGTQLFLCAGAVFASQLIQTTTITQSASTTTTITTTSTINTIGSNLFSSSSNWPVIFFILLIPAGLFLGVTRNLSGALLGLMIGAIIGVMMGILPAWAFIGLTIAMVSIAFVSRERG